MLQLSNYIHIDKLKEIIDKSDHVCISIHLNFETDINSEKNKIKYKNALQDAEKKLERYNIDNDRKDKLLKPLYDLTNNRDFWENRSKSNTILRNENELSIFRFNHDLTPATIVDKRFYIRPFIPLYKDNEGKPFHVLFTTEGRIIWKSYSHEHKSKNHTIPDHLSSYDNFLKQYDFEESLRYQSKQQNQAPNYHGQGISENDARDHKGAYSATFKNWLAEQQELSGKTLHLIGSDECLGHFMKDSEKLPFKASILIKRNAKDVSDEDVIFKILGLEEEKRQKKREKAIEKYKENKGSDDTKILYDIKDIISAAKNQRIAFMLVPGAQHNIWGTCANDDVEIHEDPNHLLGEELINCAVSTAIKNGGQVYEIAHPEENDVPQIVAVCRW